jgi:hypothetical protein
MQAMHSKCKFPKLGQFCNQSFADFANPLQRLDTRLMPLPVAMLSIQSGMLACLEAGLMTWSGVASSFAHSFRLQTRPEKLIALIT